MTLHLKNQRRVQLNLSMTNSTTTRWCNNRGCHD